MRAFGTNESLKIPCDCKCHAVLTPRILPVLFSPKHTFEIGRRIRDEQRSIVESAIEKGDARNMRNVCYMTRLGTGMFAALDVVLVEGVMQQAGAVAASQDMMPLTLHTLELVTRLGVVAGVSYMAAEDARLTLKLSDGIHRAESSE